MELMKLVAAATKIDPGKVGVENIPADDLLNGVLTTVYFLGGVVCVMVLVGAGILYATSEGDANKVKTAKNAIIYALVGLVIIMMAFVITWFVIGRFA